MGGDGGASNLMFQLSSRQNNASNLHDHDHGPWHPPCISSRSTHPYSPRHGSPAAALERIHRVRRVPRMSMGDVAGR